MIETIKENKFLFTGSSEHAISFYIEDKGTNFNIVLVNSGDGIQNHHKKIGKEKENIKYNLWKSHQIEKDLIDKVLKDILILDLIIQLNIESNISFNKLFYPPKIIETEEDDEAK